MKKQQDNRVTPLAVTGTDTQLQQLRNTIKAQVEELKKTVSIIQQQSLKEVQDAVNNAFKIFTADSLQQLSKQDNTIKKQLNQSMQEGGNINEDAPPLTLPAVTVSSIPQTNADAGRKAVEQAQISVRNAIANSINSMEEAQKAQQLPSQAVNQQQINTP